MFLTSGVWQPNLHYANRQKDYKRIDEKIKIAQANGDDWAQELRWMNHVQTDRTRSVLH
jgi:hypothetical protein